MEPVENFFIENWNFDYDEDVAMNEEQDQCCC